MCSPPPTPIHTQQIILMILNQQQIQKHTGIKIHPKPTKIQEQPCSIDLTLSDEYLQPVHDEKIDPKTSTPNYEYIVGDKILLPPHSFVLASTIEKITLPKDIVARVEGRSSIGRLGLTVHVTAGFIDPGFKGNITLEIANLSNNTIVLHKKMRICQIVFETIEPPLQAYGECGNKYQNQNGVTQSMIYYDEDL